MKLFIDSSDNKKTIIKLNGKQFTKTYSSPREQNVLGAIQQALKKEDKTLKDITEIKVNTGPGSFTGLRVGISIANALSYALKIPINDKKPGTTITPAYGKPPNISPSKNIP